IPGWNDRPLARIGEVSYSIYLLHFIVFTALAKQLAALGLPMADFTTSALLAVAAFPLIVIAAMASYEIVERPFLALRRAYDRPRAREPRVSDGRSAPAATLQTAQGSGSR
ncbi:MAG: hypothetical protein RLZ98_3213, partial [Pseudomonadota bacterium]